jgi:predicted nucleic acid-binding protein
MLFDTDVFIWAQRGNRPAVQVMEQAPERLLSVLTYMELLQAAQHARQHAHVKDFLTTFGFQILPLTENIGHRAAIYVEEYSLTSGLRAADAIIAATATEHHLSLMSGNVKHFKLIHDLRLIPFTP